MKKITVILSILAMFGFANAQFSNGLTTEVPNLRVEAMGGIYSLIETSNYADFPQRLLTGQEGAWIGTNRSDSWGLVRFNLNNFLSLPMPMAWQVSVEQMTELWLQQVFDHVGLAGFDNLGSFGMAAASTNRINSNFAIGLQNNLIAGLGIKLYSNGNSMADDNDEYTHSFWGLETTWGATMMLGGDDFFDASMDLDFWSWDGTYESNNVDLYEEGFTKCDGIMNFGLNARYYNTGEKVDYAPFMKFNYFSFSSSEKDDHDGNPLTALATYTYDGSLFNFTLGAGVHYKPAQGVKVYNEFEFRYQSISNIVDRGTELEDYESTMTLLPIYRMGVEITKEIDPKIWWGFNSVQLWGGFNKTFTDVSGQNEQVNNTTEYTDPTFNDVSVTTGAALQNGNFKVEFYTDINNLYFNDNALNNVYLGLVYMFQQ
ncbi:MAG: hypothetical protein KKD38_07415 [Candidatus Delongbacteria bacterium]|nr:hypothetical protein [Candidatus Delongbacteria bacterium]MCG2760231.1 hypothetical protein [Candidatus Delongbacteria bacterium]